MSHERWEKVKVHLFGVGMILAVIGTYVMGSLNGYRHGYENGYETGEKNTCTTWVSVVRTASMNEFISGMDGPSEDLLYVGRITKAICKPEEPRS